MEVPAVSSALLSGAAASGSSTPKGSLPESLVLGSEHSPLPVGVALQVAKQRDHCYGASSPVQVSSLDRIRNQVHDCA